MNYILNLIFICSLIKTTESNSTSSNDSTFWEDNVWLLIILIILSIALIVLIVFISIKMCRNYRAVTRQENENNFVNTERSSQKYISEYDKNGKNNKKIKYKERPLKEIEEEN